MGEVRVRVKLTNAMDEALHRRQLLKAEEIHSYTGPAVVDTGAVPMVVPQAVADQLGLALRDHRVVELADGRKERVGVTEAILVDINGRETLEEARVLGNEVLIGQTILEKVDMLVDCVQQRLVPNPEHPDQPVLKVRSTA